MLIMQTTQTTQTTAKTAQEMLRIRPAAARMHLRTILRMHRTLRVRVTKSECHNVRIGIPLVGIPIYILPICMYTVLGDDFSDKEKRKFGKKRHEKI